MNLILITLSGALVLMVASGFYATRRLEQSLRKLRVDAQQFETVTSRRAG